MEEYKPHYSVLKKECLEYLGSAESEKGIFCDMTFGAGGHSFAILQAFHDCELYAFDQDIDAILNGKINAEKLGLQGRIHFVHANFAEYKDHISNIKFDGILMDLGVSSHQFDKVERGFSYRNDAPLDMRMNQSEDIETAKDIINNYDQDDLANLIYKYGEERFSRRIAENIVKARDIQSIETTRQLEDIIFHTYPKNFRHGRTNPSTKTFQALRLAVNKELEVLEETIKIIPEALASGGILAVISFHSLEDRIVKHSFKSRKSELNDIAILTKKPIIPSEDELKENSRSRSAKLRVVRKL